MNPLNRREFLAAVAAAAALCSVCGVADVFADVPSTQPSDASTIVAIGQKSDYAQDGITTTWIKAPSKLIVVRHEGKIYALTSVCTHRGGMLFKRDGEMALECKRHHATFDVEGKVTAPPARIALARYAISADDSGNLSVDKSKTFAADQWNDPASFVAIA
jgi:nitrite reductase/ring-hydroxylating ferredoxin subunit